eukprot:7744513-Lingulodinium_polyedra.AAC.1
MLLPPGAFLCTRHYRSSWSILISGVEAAVSRGLVVEMARRAVRAGVGGFARVVPCCGRRGCGAAA